MNKTTTTTLQQRNTELLLFIYTFRKKHKYAPSYRQIQKELSISSTSLVKHRVGKLCKEKLVRHDPYVARSLRLTKLGLQQVRG